MMFPPWWMNWPYLRRTYSENEDNPEWMFHFRWLQIWWGCGLALFLCWVGSVLAQR